MNKLIYFTSILITILLTPPVLSSSVAAMNSKSDSLYISQNSEMRVDEEPSTVQPGPFTVDQKVFEQNPKSTKVYLGYFVAGFIGFILLVAALLIARRR